MFLHQTPFQTPFQTQNLLRQSQSPVYLLFYWGCWAWEYGDDEVVLRVPRVSRWLFPRVRGK